MTVIEYHLYRIKFVPDAQLDLFQHTHAKPAEIFEQAIAARPSLVSEGDRLWHLGNVEIFDRASGCFAIGRTTTTNVSKYDNDKRDFIEEAFEASAYTYCIYELNIGFVAIAKKAKLAPTTGGIAGKLSELLATTEAVRANRVTVLVDPIADPEDFLKKIDSAHAVVKFKAWFTGPNPFDADELFQKPLSVYCQRTAAKNGAVEIEGEALKKDAVSSVARSTAATGNDAQASVQMGRGQKPQRIRLRDNHVKKSYPAEHHDKKAVAADMVTEYARVRTP